MLKGLARIIIIQLRNPYPLHTIPLYFIIVILKLNHPCHILTDIEPVMEDR